MLCHVHDTGDDSIKLSNFTHTHTHTFTRDMRTCACSTSEGEDAKELLAAVKDQLLLGLSDDTESIRYCKGEKE